MPTAFSMGICSRECPPLKPAPTLQHKTLALEAGACLTGFIPWLDSIGISQEGRRGSDE